MGIEFLKEILEYKRTLLEEKKAFFSSLKEKLVHEHYARYRLFHRMISKPGQINLIAEIKKASPSAGIIREDFHLLEIAKTYVDHQAAAISILTEEKYFLGKPAFVKEINHHFNIPILVKDFIIDEGQIYEARFNGASAVLLIVAILREAQLKHLLEAASALDMDCLVEIHNEEELFSALEVGAEIIGVNNRNLRTFELDLKNCEYLIPEIPKDKIIVAESGITSHKDVETMKKLGANAVLIGETFMREKDIGRKIQEVMYGQS